jgi:RNA polymerase sigma factor (sigma-70 family)
MRTPAGVRCVMEPVVGIEQLFERDYVRLVRALGVAFDPEAAADAVQEAFIEADRRWATVAELDDPVGWIRRVALNRLRNRRRDQLRREEILATIRPVADADLTVELLDLRRALEALPERMRIVVCLFHLADLSVDDIAVTLGIAGGTVKSTLHDGRTRLRSHLEDRHHA